MKSEEEWQALFVWLETCTRDELLHFIFLAQEQMKLWPSENPPTPPATAGRVILDTRLFGGVTLQLEKKRCGKEGCQSCPHPKAGGYWYAYWSEGGKTKSRYVGKSLVQAQAFAHRVQSEGKRVGGKAVSDLA